MTAETVTFSVVIGIEDCLVWFIGQIDHCMNRAGIVYLYMGSADERYTADRRRGTDMAMTREEAWDYAIGMLKVDGLEPSEEMMEMIEREKRGEMTTEDILKRLHEKYSHIRNENK